jgi:hypothetical protein
LFPSAAHANSSIFYDHTTGAPRTLAQVRDVLTARYDVAARERPVSGATDVAQATTLPGATLASTAVAAPSNTSALGKSAPDAAKTAAAIVPDTAGVTSAFAAAMPPSNVANTDVFHSLFSDPGRTTPIASVVSQLWVTGTSPNAMSDLFKDDGKSG